MPQDIYSKAGADAATSAAISALGLGTAAVADAGDFESAGAAAAAVDAVAVDQLVLTGNLALTVPAGFPAGQVYRVTLTQDGTGGHTVTYGGLPVTVDTTAGASTLVEVWPGGSVTYPGAVVNLGRSNGTDDAPKINAALARGGVVRGLPGETYVLGGALVIPSETTLDLTGCTVTLAVGTLTRMIGNASLLGTGARDHDIAIIGGHWDRGANIFAGDAHAHAITLHRADRVRVTDVRFTATGAVKYDIYLCDVTAGTVERCDFTSLSDGVHVTGPASNIVVRDISGYTDDDLVSFTGRDYPSWELTPGGGAITDVLVDRVVMRGGDGNAVKLLPGALMTLSRAVVRNVAGTSAVNAVTLNEDTAQPSTQGGAIRDVMIDGVTFAPGDTSSCVDLSCNDSSNIRIRNITQTSATAAQAIHLVGTSLGDVEIDGLSTGTSVPHSKTLVKLAGPCVVARLRIANVAATQTSPGTVVSSSGTVGVLHMAGIRQVGGSSLIYIAAGAMPLITINGLHTTADFGVRIVASVAVELQVANATATSGNHLARAEGATASLILRGAALVSGTHFNRTGTQVMRAIGADLKGDVSKLTPAAGDIAFNNNGSLACGTGPVISNGTLWKHLYTGATT